MLAHSEEEAKKTAEVYLLEDPLGPIDYADSDTLVTPLPDDAPFPYNDYLVAGDSGKASPREEEKPKRRACRTKKAAPEAKPEAAEAKAEQTPAAEAPAPKKRAARTAKKAETAPAAAAEPAPKKRAARKKAADTEK